MIGRLVAAGGLLLAAVSALMPLKFPGQASRSDGVRYAAVELASVAPLDPRPLLASAASDADTPTPITLKRLSRALARDPRNPASRLQIAYHQLALGDFASAVFHLRALQSVRWDLEPTIIALAAEGSRTAVGRQAVAKEFADNPSLLRIMAAASALGLPSEELPELLSLTRLAEIPNGVVQAQTILIQPIIAKGRYDEAYRLWKELLPHKPSNPVFDGNFQGLEGAGPFNWTFTNDQHVQAIPSLEDPSGERGLRVETYSPDARKAAEQLLLLSQGRFQLSYKYQTDPDQLEPVFRWELRCQSGAFVAESVLQPDRAEWTIGGVEFEVSGGCSPVMLLLLTTGNRPQRVSESFVMNVRIDPS